VEARFVMIPRKIALALFALGLFHAKSAHAELDGWQPILDQARLGQGQAACWSQGENSACLVLSCRDGGAFEIGLMAYGGNFGLEPMLPVFIRVDGGPVHALSMNVLSVFDMQHAAVPYDPARHGALLAALRRGRVAEIAVYDPASNPLPHRLGDRPGAVDAAMAGCAARPPAAAGMGGGTPAQDAARFVQIDPGLAHAEATGLARGLLAHVLAREPGTEVVASIALLPDGRRILVAEHGVSTASYGITGVGTYVFTADPGGPFRQAYATTGVSLWLDLAQLSEGFPDIWVQDYRGVAQPYGLWRHLGGRYQHQRNVPEG
jgi:hypothetical protein